MSELERLIAEEAEHAELHRDDPIPAAARMSRPNRAKSVMFSLRLNPDEMAAVHELAEERGVPASAIVRGWIVQQIAAARNAPSDASGAVEQLEAAVRTLRKLVTS